MALFKVLKYLSRYGCKADYPLETVFVNQLLNIPSVMFSSVYKLCIPDSQMANRKSDPQSLDRGTHAQMALPLAEKGSRNARKRSLAREKGRAKGDAGSHDLNLPVFFISLWLPYTAG